MRRWLPLALVLCHLGALGARAETTEAQVELSAQKVTVGDRVEATLRLAWDGPPMTAAPSFPIWEGTWGQAEVLETSEATSSQDPSGREVWSQKVTLAAFEPGEVQLPPVRVKVPLGKETREVPTPEGLAFEVGSVLPEDSEEPLEPKPAAKPVEVGGNAAFLATASVLAALIVAGAFLLARRLARLPAAIASRPRLGPLAELLVGVGRLDPHLGSEPIHTGLSLALRTYLGRRLEMNAVESTTSEIQRRLRATPVPSATAQQAVRLLRDCDQVKFGRLEVEPQVAASRLEQARQLGREIEERLQPPEPDESQIAGKGAAA